MPQVSAIADSLRRSPVPANVALGLSILLAAFALAKIVWLLLSGPTLPSIAPENVSLPQATAPRVTVAQWHLFGNAAAPAIDARLAAVAQETTLKLTLRGTLNETSPDGGVAIVADENGVDESYRVGDTLPGGGRLVAIHQARVLFERDGKVESLSLPRDPAGMTASSSSGNRGASGSTARSAMPPLPALGGNVLGTTTLPSAVGIASGLPSLESLKAATGVDPVALAKQVQVFPVFANGRMRGVRLAAGRDSSLLEATGIRPNDLITAVNGIPIDGPARQTQLVASLGRGRVEVELERDGKPMKLTIGR
mgnify:CR=1 FL=1